MELTTEAFARACELMQATHTTDGHVDGFFSLDFNVGEQNYLLTFGLPNNQAMLISPGAMNTQFIFECNAITFHPKATKEGYMLLFHTVSGRMIAAKLLVAGDSHGVTHLLQYSVPASEGEVEFPRQL